MKDEASLVRSRDAALKKAATAARHISDCLQDDTDSRWPGTISKVMPKMDSMRKALNELNQRLHEANAYDNALHTD